MNNGFFGIAGNYIGRLSGLASTIYTRIISKKDSRNISRSQSVIEIDSRGIKNYDLVLGDQRGTGAIRTLAEGEYFPSDQPGSTFINKQGGPYSVNWITNQPLYSAIQNSTGSVVLGGRNVYALSTANYSVVGGQQNSVSGAYAVSFLSGDNNANYGVFLGRNGTASSQYSTVLSSGNYPRQANRNYSVVLAGVRAYSYYSGEVLIGGLTTFPGIHFYVVNKKLTTDATTDAFKIQIAFYSANLTFRPSYFLNLTISAIQTGGTSGTVGDSASWIIKGGVKFDTTNNAAAIGSFVTETRSDLGASTWTATPTINNSATNKFLDIEIIGENNKTIQWVMTIDGTRLGY